MDAIECIKNRMSIRKFKPEPVPQEVLRDVINTAQRSPSYKNSQPWEVAILSGARKEALSKMLIDLLNSGKQICPDLAPPETWPAAEEARIADLFRKRKEMSGIDLSVPENVIKAKKANFNFYGAPHAIYLFQEASLSQWSLFDMGLFAQTLMLAACAKGLGTVPQAFATDYAEEVKKHLNIPASKRLVLGISIGYPDMESPANALRTDRSSTDEIISWLE